MFKNFKLPQRKPATTDEGFAAENAELQSTVEDLQEKIKEQNDLLDYYRQAAVLIDTSVEEAHDRVPVLLRPTFRSLTQLNMRQLAALPTLILDQDPKADKIFTQQIGLPMERFHDPAQTSAELLAYRMHTIAAILTSILANENVAPSDVRFQANNDVKVVLRNEEARNKERNRKRSRLERLVEGN